MREAEGLSRLHNTIIPPCGTRLRIHAKNRVHSRSAAAVAVGPRLVRPSDLKSEAVVTGSELRTRGIGQRLGSRQLRGSSRINSAQFPALLVVTPFC